MPLMTEQEIAFFRVTGYVIKRGAIDNRSYRANFDKIEKDLGWTPKHSIEDAVHAIVTQLDNKQLVKTTQSVTLDWYKEINAFA